MDKRKIIDRPWLQNAQHLGGVATGIQSRQHVLDKYYKNPNKCKECGKIIEVKNGQQVSEARKKQFCNHICAGKHNYKNLNLPFSRRISTKIKKYCQKCHIEIFGKPQHCRDCTKSIRFETLTKGDLFKTRKNWQCARSMIQKNARKDFSKSGKPAICEVKWCNYALFIEVCHKKPVSEFDDNTLIKDINAIENLSSLCRNHHWEADRGLLKYDFLTNSWIKI